MHQAKLTEQEIRAHKGVSFTGITTVFFCYDSANRLFLAKRSRNARDEHGRWNPGSGGLKHGQTAEGNLRRELKEEYDTEPLCIDFIGYHDVFQALPDGTPTHWLALDFAVKVDPNTIRINEPHMVDDHGWFTLDSLPHPMHSQFGPFLQLHGDKLQRIMQRN